MYNKHHREKLGMIILTFDFCLLISNEQSFGITGMQTDDIINLCTDDFSAKEKNPEGSVPCKAQKQAIGRFADEL
jgi:hypothetical protein